MRNSKCSFLPLCNPLVELLQKLHFPLVNDILVGEVRQNGVGGRELEEFVRTAGLFGESQVQKGRRLCRQRSGFEVSFLADLHGVLLDEMVHEQHFREVLVAKLQAVVLRHLH